MFPQLGSYAADHAALAQVFLKALTTSPVFMVRADSPGFHMVMVASNWVMLSVSNLLQKELRSSGSDAGRLPAT